MEQTFKVCGREVAVTLQFSGLSLALTLNPEAVGVSRDTWSTGRRSESSFASLLSFVHYYL